MTQSKYPAKLNKKLAHNLEQVAGELVTYISELDSVRELVKHTTDGKAKYEDCSWLMWLLFYRWSRGRSPEFDALAQTLNQSGNSFTLIEAFDQFLSSGGDIITSGALRLLTQLSLGLPGYADTEKEFSLTETNLQDLRTMVLIRTDKILRPAAGAATPEEIEREDAFKKQQMEQTEQLHAKLELDKQRVESENIFKLDLLRKIELEKELQHLPRRNIKQAANELAESTRFIGKKTEVNKLDEKKYGTLKTELNGLYHNLLVKKGILKPEDIQSKPVKEGAAMKNKPGKLKPDFLEDMNKQLGGMLSGAAVDYFEKLKMEEKVASMYPDAPPSNPVTPPSSPVQPCAAAFEAPVVSAPVTGDAKEMVFNSEQAAAMFSIFGSAQKVKVKPPKQYDPESKSSPIASR